MPAPDAAEMLEDIQSASRARSGGIELDEWQEGFVEQIAKQLKAKRVLTSKQLAKLTEIWDRI